MIRRTIPFLVLSALVTACEPLPPGAPAPVADLHVLASPCPQATIPPEYRFTPASDLPAAAQGVVDGALAEWRRWGRQIVDYREVDWARTAAVRDLAGLPGVGGPVVPVIAALGCWENDPRMFRVLQSYWAPVPAVDEAGQRERYVDDLADSAVAVSAGRPPGWTQAWSAAFISYVVTRSAPAPAFRYSQRHADYVEAAIAEALNPAGVHRYVARPVTAFSPRPGDLICSYRGQPRREAWDGGRSPWRLGAAHCDVVVATERQGAAARVLAVGGNIFQSVSLSVHALAPDGRLVDTPFRNWAVVLADTGQP